MCNRVRGRGFKVSVQIRICGCVAALTITHMQSFFCNVKASIIKTSMKQVDTVTTKIKQPYNCHVSQNLVFIGWLSMFYYIDHTECVRF